VLQDKTFLMPELVASNATPMMGFSDPVLRIKRKRNQEPLDGLGRSDVDLSFDVAEFLNHNAATIVVDSQHFDKRHKASSAATIDGSLPGTTAGELISDRFNRESMADLSASNEHQEPKFFKLISTLEHTQATDQMALGETVQSQRRTAAETTAPPLTDQQQHQPPHIPSSMGSSRYRFIPLASDSQKQQDSPYQVLDVAKEEDLPSPTDEQDTVLCNLMPMVREYLQISTTDKSPKEPMDESDYVYDIYLRDDMLDVSQAPLRMAALIWEDPNDPLLLHDLADEDKTSRLGDDDYDSNAESHDANDYPDEETLSYASYEDFPSASDYGGGDSDDEDW
jgi:hypothetical protein